MPRRDFALFVWLPAVLSIGLVVYLSVHHQFAFDFRREYRVAGWRLLHDRSAYSWTRAQIASDTAYPYPAVATLLFVPFALLPTAIGAVLFTAAAAASLLVALRVLEVRDWRLYGLVMIFAPVVAGWQSANLTLPLVLGLALVWRLRERPLIAGLLTAAMISLKPLVWPVALWLLVTRRLRALAACILGGLAINAVAWAVVGTSQIGAYVRLIRRETDQLYRVSYGVMALTHQLGASRSIGIAVLVAASAVLVLMCVRIGARDEWGALLVCVILALVASPLVDSHYFALAIVALAIRQPRLSLEWLLPLVLWLCPETASAGWQQFLAWATLLLLAGMLVRRGPSERSVALPAG